MFVWTMVAPEVHLSNGHSCNSGGKHQQAAFKSCVVNAPHDTEIQNNLFETI